MNIFVARLSPNTTDETLLSLFQAYGSVSSTRVIFDRDTGKSKCFGFVEMSNDQEASEAINDLDGMDLEGSIISVKQARPRDENSNQNNTRSFNHY